MADSYYNLANENFVSEDYDSAVHNYDLAIKADPSFVSAISLRAATFIKLKKYAQAVEDCNNVIRLDESVEPAYYRKG